VLFRRNKWKLNLKFVKILKNLRSDHKKEMMEVEQANLEASENFLDALDKNVDISFKPRTVLPGDDVTSEITRISSSIKIGPGLQQLKDGKIMATTAGMLSYRPKNQYWIDTSKKRYYPKVGDQVVGIIEDRGGEHYIVNIFTGIHCILNRLSFEGATKRNKPELKKGDVIYARVLSAERDGDTVLTCTSSGGIKKEWSSGETVYGLLPSGLTLHVSTGFVKRLLRPDNVCLSALGKAFVYEAAIGMNGLVWIRAQTSSLELVIIRNAILNAEQLADDLHVEVMVEQLIALAAQKHSSASSV